MAGFSEYDSYDGLELAELVRKGEVHPSELVEAAIERIEALNPQLNAVIYTMYDMARQAAQGPLPDGPFKGVPFLLKDLMAAYAGVPLRNGSRFHKDFVPDHDSEIVRRYKAAGVVILGKTNTPEYGLVPITEPALFGPSHNPWAPDRSTGGSSGGSAAAVAARVVPLAHGNDGGGSIRIPASCCGLFGLKPSRGRNPLGPDISEAWHGLAIDHVLTRSVRDSAAMLDATAGPDVGAPYVAPPPQRPFLDEVGRDPGALRIAYSARPFVPSAVDADCLKALDGAVALCRGLGHEVEEAAPLIDGEAFQDAFFTMACGDTCTEIEMAQRLVGRTATARDFEPSTWTAALIGAQLHAPEFAAAVNRLQHSAREVGPFFERYDILMTPTLASPPPAIGALQPPAMEALAMRVLGALRAGRLLRAVSNAKASVSVDRIFRFMPYTPLFNATGQPAMSVPLHWNEAGLPVGVQFVAKYGDEATLFRLAAQLEQAQPWANRVPPVRV